MRWGSRRNVSILNHSNVGTIPELLSPSPILATASIITLVRKPGNHPNFEKNALGVKRPFSEQLSEFRGILGATLGMALTT